MYIVIIKQEENKMKEKYTTPEMELVEFETEDIITESNKLQDTPID